MLQQNPDRVSWASPYIEQIYSDEKMDSRKGYVSMNAISAIRPNQGSYAFERYSVLLLTPCFKWELDLWVN